MKIPLDWLQNYITLEHSEKDFGDIMTKLEFMQDGQIETVANQKVIDLEVRQNRPDILSIIGAAREYAAYVGKEIKYPKQVEEIEKEWGPAEKNLKVKAKDIVKRFCTVEIKNIKIKKSCRWMQNSLEAYGITPINNLVDITNYVMLEYGMPLHAFDVRKLAKENNHPLLTLRMADDEEQFVTWQGTKVKLTTKDLVVADAKKPVAIAGIIGGANSDIDAKTTHIILEGATYDHASIRRTSLRHAIRTEASTRHEKFLNPEMVETAIKRTLFLIQDLCKGEIVKIEDYYENKYEPILIDFDINEITRLGGVQIELEEATTLLRRLGFEILDKKDAPGVGQNFVVVRVPKYRTDVTQEADLVEEVLRLWGYEKIPSTKITSAPPDFSTSNILLLEEKLRNILVSLGLDEHITNPLVRANQQLKKQIILENPLNDETNALRTSIRKTLEPAIETNIKHKIPAAAVFEVGKVYFQEKEGEYKEERRIETLYYGYSFETKVKPDFIAVLRKLNLYEKNLDINENGAGLSYFSKKQEIARLYHSGYIIFTGTLSQLVDQNDVPHTEIYTQFVQTISEDITIVVDPKTSLDAVERSIFKASKYIKEVYASSTYEGEKNSISVTLTIVFEDLKKELRRKDIERAKKKIISSLNLLSGIKVKV